MQYKQLMVVYAGFFFICCVIRMILHSIPMLNDALNIL